MGKVGGGRCTVTLGSTTGDCSGWQRTKLGLERYWYWVIGYWAVFTGIG